MIRILLADDQELVRAGFRFILDSHEDLQVVAEAGDGVEALRLAKQTQPDVCLVDIQMPRLDGLTLTRRLTELPAAPKVVILTTFDLESYVTEALTNGALGFILKHSEPELLIAGVRAAVRGDALLSPQITLTLLTKLKGIRSGAGPGPDVLTEREREIVAAAGKGLSNTEICAEIHLSLSTVKGHLTTAQQKIGARNRVEVAVWAWRNNLVDDPR
ncbi:MULTISPECIES: response regulator [Amycolatopsis]|uniref:LuxR family two component transcriptional regulator n=2 Tax=Amycolatopsis TaxID=1813 RepID=A0A2A9F607_9PSEU|nr:MULTISPECIES: response regulator transcription factor [Amycolatopsis]PFG46403.1 LuxR family two component transcriptional regulator [Amycolatopsis sulphurea]RJQ88219.1 DNA-binding response regulator [Amycolatopsis panacis]